MNTNLAIKTSKIRANKNAIYAISLILIFAFSIAMTFAPTASAQPGVTMPRQSYGYISAAPLLIGVGQQLTVNAWVGPLPVGYSGSAWYGPPPGFLGFSVTFTRPDGTKDTFMPTDPFGNFVAGESEVLGILSFFYSPNMAGNWSVTMSMPAQNFTDASGTVLYTACTSSPAYFTVTTEEQNAGLLNGWPWSLLPNDNVYWTYPISANNREWTSIAAPMWPQGSQQSTAGSGGTGSWQPYGSAPSTAHIVWQVQGGLGGIIGGELGNLALQGAGSSPIIFEGKAYISGINNLGGFNCYDLTNGKLLYSSNNSVTRAIVLPGNIYSQATAATQNTGVELAGSAAPNAYLFGTSGSGTASAWNYINPLNGLIQKQITNATLGTGIMTEYSPLVYGSYMSGQVAFSPYYMATNFVWGWNYTKVASNNDWYTGLMWKTNVSRHWGGVNDSGPGDGIGRTQGFVLSADMSTIEIGGSAGNYLAKGFSTTDGHSVWNVSLGYVGLSSSNGALYSTNTFVTYESPQGTFRCYSILTGALLWTSTNAGTLPWYTQSYGHANDANNMYIPSIDGSVVALSLTDGHKVWQSAVIPSTEMIFNALPCYNIPVIAGGFVYEYLGYAISYEQEPIPRFAVTACFNATTGATVWVLNGGNNPTAECNGYLFTTGVFNGIISCIGKGQTSTSVSTPDIAVTEGSTVVIKGNVLDQSPAQPGTPAVSDSSMSEQMDYLHMQNATLLNNPPKEQGVPVTLIAVDPNNNTITIGTTTTDSLGNYGYTFVPNTSGMYTITANFAGTNSYWPSSSGAKLAVTAAPTTTSGTSTTTTSSGVSATELYTIGAAIIIVIIVVAIVLALLMLRKKP